MLIFLRTFVAQSLTFNITRFGYNDSSINLAGDAYVSNQGIQLTPNERGARMTDTASRATYVKALHLWDKESGNLTDFNTHFSFIINSMQNKTYADGIAFFLVPYGSGIPPGTAGSSLGLAPFLQDLNTKINQFVTVEFDTFKNDWDPEKEHVGIDVNSMKSIATLPWFCSILDGRQNDAWISYNSTTQNLSAVFTGFINDTKIQQHISSTIDLRLYLPDWVTIGFSAATGFNYEINTIVSWDFSSHLQADENKTVPISPVQRKGDNKLVLVLKLVGGAVFLLLLVGVLVFCFCRRNGRKHGEYLIFLKYMDSEFRKYVGPTKFPYNELARATNNFSEKAKLGVGGFGFVYKGFLKNLNRDVAVKRLSRGSNQGIKEYAAEVKIISQLNHKNLVKLIGWCHEKRELLLVYEFMDNFSLDYHLYNDESSLEWPTRYTIAQGLASAMYYLQERCDQCILHRDIKSSNIMLDSNFQAKLGDFGLARFVDHEKGSQTTVPAGTIGYMAPECITSGKASKESDIYSFGVVALEIVCGRKPFLPEAEEKRKVITEWVWELYGRGELLEAVDQKLGDAGIDQVKIGQMERLLLIGLWCSHPDPSHRPSMVQVISVLNMGASLQNLPPRAACPVYPLNVSPLSISSSYGFMDSGRGQTQPTNSTYFKTASGKSIISSSTSLSATSLSR
ncbi:Legume lectin domain [Dillenia turbinata]|uniref:non-specific serine/threonine protein kinase n=1 Tax=Dillenia turbinata TaxID=194707 RepID=A0AAN8ZUL8_9MAGN